LISFLLKGTKSYADLASKKGIALTIGIAAAIIGSSFLIWYMPQSSPGAFGPPLTDNEVIAGVYARHYDLATDIDARFEQWKNNDPVASDTLVQLDSAKSQLDTMRQDLDNRQPAQEWKESYDLYIQALDAYGAYLNALGQKVDGSDRTDPDPELTQNWQDLVDESINAMPTNN